MRSSRALAVAAAAFASLTVLAAILPFETSAPLFVLGPVGVTTSELALYLTLLLWAAGRGLGSPGSWSAAHGLAFAWAAAVLISAVAAPEQNSAALKFALRSLSGTALFYVTADCVSSSSRSRRVLLALVTGALVTALAALAEVCVPGVARALLVFKPKTFHAAGGLRASGTLAYPTLAAMYLEAALPLLLVSRPGPGRGRWAARAVLLLLVLEAIVLTGSRAGAVVALATLLAVAWSDRRELGLGGLALFGALSLVGLAGADLALRPGTAERLSLRGDGAWYRADFRPEVASLDLGTSETRTVSLRLRNEGAVDWAADGEAAVCVSYEWLDLLGVVVLEGPQVPLGRATRRGEEAVLAVPVRAPDVPGAYRLRWQLGRDGATWAGAAADGSLEITARVTSRERAAEGRALTAPGARPTQTQLTRLELWRTGWRLWRERPLLGVGPDNFRHLYARSLGPRPLDDRIRANSLYVETLADTGLLGAAALLGLVAALGALARRHWRATQNPARRRWLLGAALGFSSFLLHGVVDDFLAFTPTLGLFWILAGLLAAPGPWSETDPAH